MEAAVVKLNNYIKQIAVDVEDDIFLKASIPAEDDIQMSKKTIIGRSQFTLEFLKVTEESMNVLEKEERTISVDDNAYKCEGIINLLTGHYLGLFPLWSSIFLGNMAKYATDSKKPPEPTVEAKTRDTNSHVECWFGILKNSILQRRRKMRPADFICRLHSSLQGRYREHIIGHGLLAGSKRSKGKRKNEATDLTEEQWAKRVTAPQKSKYYSVPVTMPVPKKIKNKKADKRRNNSASDKNGIPDTDVKASTTGIQTMACDVSKEDVQQLHNTKQLKTWSETAAIKDPQENVIFLSSEEIKMMKFIK